MTYHPVIRDDQLAEGAVHGARIGKAEIVVVRVRGRVQAFEDACPHRDAPLSDMGRLEDGELVCVLHGARFDGETGELLAAPSPRGLRRYPTRVRDGMIEVAVEGVEGAD